jgi:adenosylmethionine-8-amino-7-oxononanoate aminotransferase
MPLAPSESLVARSLRSVWHPCTQMQHHETVPLVPLRSGAGAWLTDVQGHRYLDAVSSWWVNLFGHANPQINAALKEQLDTLEHAMLAGFTHEPVVALSEKLAARTQQVLGHCFFASDGASAIEIALKMSFHAWRNAGHTAKQQFVCFEGGYHGETLGALSVTDVAVFRDAYAHLLRPAHFLPSPDERLAGPGEAPDAPAQQSLHAFEVLLASQSDEICAVVVEPLVQCASGMAMHGPAFLRQLRRLCDQYQVHLIADEIAVGCGRTGTFFACEQAGIWPDFLCLSKGISGGYLPLSLVMTRDEIYASFYDPAFTRGFLHSHSYTGNPLACRAALATLAIFDSQPVLERNRALSQRILNGLAELQHHPRVRHVRQRGMITAFDVHFDDAVQTNGFSRRFFTEALQHELLLRPIGQTVYFMPPYILSDDEADVMTSRTLQVLDKVLRVASVS